MNSLDKKFCIYGTRGFGREVLCCLIDMVNDPNLPLNDYVSFLVDDEFYTEEMIMGVKVLKRSNFDPNKYNVVISFADPKLRKKIVEELPHNTTYASIIHPTAVLSKSVHVGEGAIITAGTILTCNITIGKHAHLNLHTTIGHDCIIGNFFTTAPAVNISGNCKIGECVYFGTNSCVREKIEITNNVTIGMGSVITKNLTDSGVYIGNPGKLMKKNNDL